MPVVDLSNRILAFMHMPKAGGNTMKGILTRSYAAGQVCQVPPEPDRYEAYLSGLDSLKRDRISLVMGHFSYGIHKLLPREVAYVTVLRHPVDRVVSEYFYACQEVEHRHHDAIQRGRLSIHDYVQREWVPALDNRQTRFLSGRKETNWYTGTDKCGEEDLEAAKQHLKEHFVMAGLQECFNEAVVMFCALVGWPVPLYGSRNVTRLRVSVDAIDGRTHRAILEHEKYDVALYDWVCNEFTALRRRHCLLYARARWSQRMKAAWGSLKG